MSGTILSDTHREGGALILEIIGPIVAGGIVVYSSYQRSGGSSDAGKIQRICANCGLTVKEAGKTKNMQLLRRTRHDCGTEYAYRIPLGLSFSDFEKKKEHLQDGLNNKRLLLDISLNDIGSLKLSRNIIRDVKLLLSKKKHVRKEIELSYDGLLKIMVYNERLTELFPFDESLFVRCNTWEIPIGITICKFIKHNFEQIPHLIVAGTTRYGKTVFLKSLITTLVHKHPKLVKLTLIDLKGGLAFNRFKNISQVECVAKNVQEALDALKEIKKGMNERFEEFLNAGYEDAKEANFSERNFIVIDEGAELASKGETDPELKVMKQECESILADIARRGGGVGYRVIFATQYPTADTLPRQVKQNIDAKLCFKLQTEIASQVVLGEGETDAAHLPLVKGRGIYLTDRKRIVQTPYIQNDFIEEMIKPHIVIKARKEDETPDGKVSPEGNESRKYTLEFEETSLS